MMQASQTRAEADINARRSEQTKVVAIYHLRLRGHRLHNPESAGWNYTGRQGVVSRTVCVCLLAEQRD